MKPLIALIIALIVIAGGAYWYTQMRGNSAQNTATDTTQQTATTTPPPAPTVQPQVSIGKTVSGTDIMAYNFGTGPKKILFVGGLHGGYEWNTVMVANQLIQELKANPSDIPVGVTVTVIPVVNTDGLLKVIGSSTPIDSFTASNVNKSQAVQVAGRFNANNVDLNRNFDCDWQAKGVWQSKSVSGGSAAFSEPESKAIQDYITANSPTAVVVWYSSAGGVFASNCHNGVLPETTTISKLYADASGYPIHQSWDFYATTGDMVNWLAKMNVPAFSVLLTNHTDSEWDKNLAGIKAVLQHYAQ